MVSFGLLQSRFCWRPIRGCPGRYVLRDNKPNLHPEQLLGEPAELREYHPSTTADAVLVVCFLGGGLLSFRKPDGTFVHTLNTPDGLRRRLLRFGIELDGPDAKESALPEVTPLLGTDAATTMEITRDVFRVRSFDADALGFLTAPRLLDFLLEAAGQSADALGIGIGELRRRGLTWVLGRLRIVVAEPIRWGQTLEVQTWPSGVVRSAAWRDFRMIRDGRAIGQATSVWFAVDWQKRVPVRPQELLPERLHAVLPHEVSLSQNLEELTIVPTLEHAFAVRRADIDLNQHVTASSYLTWAMETVPEDHLKSRRLAGLDVQYLEECRFGDTVVAGAAPCDSQELLHRIARQSDGLELARLQSTWVER